MPYPFNGACRCPTLQSFFPGIVSGILFLAALLSAGCARVGPSVIQGERNDYNVVLQRSSDQQLLLNLVRLKYRDTPFFLEVGSVASQFSLQTDASASAQLPEIGTNIFDLGAGITVEERPTVTYTPLQGEKFIQRFLSHIPLETVVLLHHSGWSIERVFRLCFQRLNGLKNAPGASGPTPLHPPEFEEFTRVAKLFRTLQLLDALEVSLEMEEKRPCLDIRVGEEFIFSPEVRELNRLLELPEENRRFILSTGPLAGKANVRTETRSLLGILYYLSHATEVPSQDIREGRVTLTRRSGGESFDWTEMTGDLLRIRSAPQKPEHTAVVVPYRNSWFYLGDSDLNSKSTFSLLAQIFSLQAEEGKGLSPFLTLPVGK